MVELTEKGMGLPSPNITRLQPINDISVEFRYASNLRFLKTPDNLNLKRDFLSQSNAGKETHQIT